MLTIEFEFFNLELQGGSLARTSNATAYIVAKFATGAETLPQHIAEEAFREPGDALEAPGTIGGSLAPRVPSASI